MTDLIYTVKMGGCAVRAKYCEGVGEIGVGGVGFREVGGRRNNSDGSKTAMATTSSKWAETWGAMVELREHLYRIAL